MKPLLLLTNDDGYRAKGINELTKALREQADIIIMAPEYPQSGMSSALSATQAIRYRLVSEEKGLTIYSCTGTPVDCVKLAIGQVLKRRPDAVISGINHGTNIAISVHYSGTLGAAIEGCINNLPAIAFSLTDVSPEANFEETCRLAKQLTAHVLKEGLPRGTYLSLNVPNKNKVKGIKICKQADSKWDDEHKRSKDGFNHDVFWMTGHLTVKDPTDQLNDTTALEEGYASLVPCKIDVTDYDYMDSLTQKFNL